MAKAKEEENKVAELQENIETLEDLGDFADVLSGYSLEDVKKGLKMLEQREQATKRRAEKIARGEITIDPEKKRAQQTKQWVKNLLMVRKAKEAGLSVSEAEIDDYIATQKAARV